ncbi:MAG: hypothetical protein BEH78_06540 [Pseudomonas sp. BDAL1]|nr:MAG: hypothetical protein BEH78_06540 [Pseudomonas sp. BDAL1]
MSGIREITEVTDMVKRAYQCGECHDVHNNHFQASAAASLRLLMFSSAPSAIKRTRKNMKLKRAVKRRFLMGKHLIARDA